MPKLHPTDLLSRQGFKLIKWHSDLSLHKPSQVCGQISTDLPDGGTAIRVQRIQKVSPSLVGYVVETGDGEWRLVVGRNER